MADPSDDLDQLLDSKSSSLFLSLKKLYIYFNESFPNLLTFQVLWMISRISISLIRLKGL